MNSDEFKNNLRNIKCFLLKGDLENVLAIYDSLIFARVQQSSMPSPLHRLLEIASTFVNNISLFFLVDFSCKNLLQDCVSELSGERRETQR